MPDLMLVRQKLEQRRKQLSERLSHIEGDLRRLANRDSEEQATEAENDEVLERLNDAETAEMGDAGLEQAVGRDEKPRARKRRKHEA